MVAYLVRRILEAAVLVFIVTVVAFFLIHAAPGGPALLSNPELSREQIQQMRQTLGLEDPLPVQYLRWLSNVLRGNLGVSYSTVEPVTALIASRLPNTLMLSGLALLLSFAVAVPLGVISALRRNSALDRLVTGFSFVGTAVPVFWLGIVLILVFAVQLRLLPAGGMFTPGSSFSLPDRLRHLVLPTMVLVVLNLAAFTRYTRSAMITVLAEDYIRTARAKGLAEMRVIAGHALKNALIPVVSVLGVYIPRAVSGAAITEAVFAWPGMGQLAVQAASTRDYPVVLGVTLTVALVVVLSSLLTDLAYAYLDPRIRLG